MLETKDKKSVVDSNQTKTKDTEEEGYLCPVCNYFLSPEDEICPVCGLKLK